VTNDPADTRRDPADDKIFDSAVAIAREAGALLRDRFGQPHDVRLKGTVDLVTEVDRAAEDLIRGRVAAAFPAHHFLGEEGGGAEETAHADTPYRWIVDPLDGTTNYAHGLPHFAVSIAVEQNGAPLVGVVYDPIREELFAAARGKGATRNGAPLQVSATDDLVASLLTTGFSYDLGQRKQQAKVWQALLTRVQAIRQTGSAALNLCYIAAGRLDGYWERYVSAWDVAGGALIVTEAGGSVTDFTNGAFRPDGGEVLATNRHLHAILLDVIAENDGN
jgi:myo-inositol-1(or 4)-monophosphatase